MEVISAILSEVGCSASDSAEVVNQKLSAKDWSSFTLGSVCEKDFNFSILSMQTDDK